MKNFVKKYSHAWTLLYVFIYVPWFFWLEKTIVTDYKPMYIWLDDKIPFIEYFIIPYHLWFIYVAGVVAFILFTSKEEFYKTSAMLFIGMTICLFIYTIFPNGQDLRPVAFDRDNLFTRAVASIYAADTNTNVLPSIHTYNSICIHIAIMRSNILKNRKWIKFGSLMLCISIILSTMFLKQHSALDAISAFVLAGIMFVLVYVVDYASLRQRAGAFENDSLNN